LHDENSDTDPPGPIASQDWLEGWLDTVAAYGKPSQWVVELGAYGYDWAKGSLKAETISFADAMTRAGRAGLSSISWRPPPTIRIFPIRTQARSIQSWFLDVVTFINH